MTNKRTLIIAEAGVNHNGDLATAKKMVEIAAKAGADIIKFQTFKAQHLVTSTASKASYQMERTSSAESQFEMLKKLELSKVSHLKLIEHSRKYGIGFLSTSFDIASVDFLHELGINLFKIPSGEITNLPYLRHIGKKRSEVILSTGMANLGEIESAIEILITEGTDKEKITLLHCTTEYPAPTNEVNLNAILSMQKCFQTRVGYSDHTDGIAVAIAAVALGACVIEKHFTLDRHMSGPDHQASLEPETLAEMIASIRSVETALGDGIKRTTESEKRNKSVVRKSIVASRAIFKGELLTEQNLTVKRPGLGISPMRWDEILGTQAIRDFQPDDLIVLK